MARILVVDDSATIRTTLGLILKRQHKTITAVNGQDALEKLSYNIIDLVLSDIHMPVMDGHELLRYLRDDPRYCQLPVIMLTQSMSPQDKIEANNCGANIYLSKPVSSGELLDIINRFVNPQGQETKPLPPLPPIDRNKLLPLMEDDEMELESFLAVALPLFKKEACQLLHSLEKAINEGGLEEIRQISHNLRGSSSSLGATRLAQLCFELESYASRGIVDGLMLKFIETQAEMARIRVYIDNEYSKETFIL